VNSSSDLKLVRN